MAKSSLYDKADNKLRKISGTIGAVLVIIGAITGCVSWLNTQLKDAISTQVNALQKEMQEADERTEIQITRLELMTLIDIQPENVAEIEKVAKHYFRDLEANWYLSGVYSSWAKEYGGDVNIAIGAD